MVVSDWLTVSTLMKLTFTPPAGAPAASVERPEMPGRATARSVTRTVCPDRTKNLVARAGSKVCGTYWSSGPTA